jgi:hypothetical protein
MSGTIIDELTPIAVYMASEMNHNPHCELGKQLKRLNSSTETCVTELMHAPWWRQLFGIKPEDCARMGLNDKYIALLLWKDKVGTDKDWDHKPKIKKRRDLWSRSTGSSEWHVYGDVAYSWDAWSNIHYGYVGRAVGFGPEVLLDGAGIAQFVSDIKTQGWPKGTGPWLLPRRWDRPEDRISIGVGIQLYRQMSVSVTPDVLVKAVTTTPGLLRRSPDAIRAEVGVPGTR